MWRHCPHWWMLASTAPAETSVCVLASYLPRTIQQRRRGAKLFEGQLRRHFEVTFPNAEETNQQLWLWPTPIGQEGRSQTFPKDIAAL